MQSVSVGHRTKNCGAPSSLNHEAKTLTIAHFTRLLTSHNCSLHPRSWVSTCRHQAFHFINSFSHPNWGRGHSLPPPANDCRTIWRSADTKRTALGRHRQISPPATQSKGSWVGKAPTEVFCPRSLVPRFRCQFPSSLPTVLAKKPEKHVIHLTRQFLAMFIDA